MENYIKGGMLYGIYPSINLGKDEDHYWANASIFERDRELFKKYIPIIKEISRAGWEPIPYANSDNSKIKLERFGNSSSNKMYFVLYNSGLDIEDGKVSIEKFLLSNKKIVNLTEIIYSKNIKYNINNQLIELNIRLNPEDTAVYELDLI